MLSPLADRIRPVTLDDVVGQQHLLGRGRVLRNIIESKQIPNMIFYGPSGVGKTTVAAMIAQSAQKKLHKLNSTTASTADIKAVIEELDTFAAPNGILLYLDEIQYFNKKQQQILLEYIENGKITLIASTTENPYFYIYNAILSRCTVFEFKNVSAADIEKAVVRGFDKMQEVTEEKIVLEDGVAAHISRTCGGDVRKAMNAVELCVLSAPSEEGLKTVTLAQAQQLSQKSSMRYDRQGDEHYDILSAFQKSIRGSDPDAAMHYLARLILAEDLPSICRRLLVTASEDIGLAYPQGVVVAKACVDSALQLGFPEARIPLAQAVLLLATAPKSNSAICAIDAAMSDIQAGHMGEVPDHLKDSHYQGAKKMGRGLTYQYAHNFPHHYVRQQYLPDLLKDRVYYQYGPNKIEQAAKDYWDKIKKPPES